MLCMIWKVRRWQLCFLASFIHSTHFRWVPELLCFQDLCFWWDSGINCAEICIHNVQVREPVMYSASLSSFKLCILIQMWTPLVSQTTQFEVTLELLYKQQTLPSPKYPLEHKRSSRKSKKNLEASKLSGTNLLILKMSRPRDLPGYSFTIIPQSCFPCISLFEWSTLLLLLPCNIWVLGLWKCFTQICLSRPG